MDWGNQTRNYLLTTLDFTAILQNLSGLHTFFLSLDDDDDFFANLESRPSKFSHVMKRPSPVRPKWPYILGQLSVPSKNGPHMGRDGLLTANLNIRWS